MVGSAVPLSLGSNYNHLKSINNAKFQKTTRNLWLASISIATTASSVPAQNRPAVNRICCSSIFVNAASWVHIWTVTGMTWLKSNFIQPDIISWPADPPMASSMCLTYRIQPRTMPYNIVWTQRAACKRSIGIRHPIQRRIEFPASPTQMISNCTMWKNRRKLSNSVAMMLPKRFSENHRMNAIWLIAIRRARAMCWWWPGPISTRENVCERWRCRARSSSQEITWAITSKLSDVAFIMKRSVAELLIIWIVSYHLISNILISKFQDDALVTAGEGGIVTIWQSQPPSKVSSGEKLKETVKHKDRKAKPY